MKGGALPSAIAENVDGHEVPNGSKLHRQNFAWSVLYVSGIFVACSLTKFPIPGVNEPHYLCKARSFVEPTWCAGDFFLESSNAHAVFFAVVGPFTQWFSLETVAFGGRIISLIFLAVGWVMVAVRLTRNMPAAVSFVSFLAALAFCGIAITGNFSGEWIVGGFESKVPAYAFALIGVARWMDAFKIPTATRYGIAGCWLGLSVAFHPVVGAWFCLGIAMAEAWQWLVDFGVRKGTSRRSLASFTWHGVCFSVSAIVVSLPGLVPALQSVLTSDIPRADTDKANLIQVFWRLAHHLDPSTFPPAAWQHTAVLLFVCGTGIAIVRRLNGNQIATGLASDAWRCLASLLVMSLLIAAVGTAIGWHSEPAQKMPLWQLRAFLLKFYPFRLFDALLPITASFAVAVIAERWLKKYTLLRGTLTLILAATVFWGAFRSRANVPGGYSAGQFASWTVACKWLKHNVPPDSLIHGPREGFALKWYAERAEYVCFKDCPQDAAGILEWDRRLWVMHDWAKGAYTDEIFDNADLHQLHEQTGITHILTRRLGPFDAAPIFQSGDWKVYAVASAD